MTSASLRRFVLGFTSLLLLVVGLASAPAAQASTDAVLQSKAAYFQALADVGTTHDAWVSAVADDITARDALAAATTARTTAKDNVASALSTLRNATAAYQADPTPSTREARNTASYQLADAKSAYSEARTAYANAKATRDGTLTTRRAALTAYNNAIAATGLALERLTSDAVQALKTIVVDVLGVAEFEVSPSKHYAADLGADSLDLVELKSQFESGFEIALAWDPAGADLGTDPTVQDTIDWVLAAITTPPE